MARARSTGVTFRHWALILARTESSPRWKIFRIRKKGSKMITGPKLTLPDPERDHIQGAIDAPIALLEYGDYECPSCGEVQPIVREIQRRLEDDLCFAFRHFLLTNVHPHAEHAAEAAEAAGEQGSFWPMHEDRKSVV